jgi:hypothetical protein
LRTANAFGRSDIGCKPFHKRSFVTSSRNCPNATCLLGVITETPPQHDHCVMTVSCGARYSQHAMNELQQTDASVIQV